ADVDCGTGSEAPADWRHKPRGVGTVFGAARDTHSDVTRLVNAVFLRHSSRVCCVSDTDIEKSRVSRSDRSRALRTRSCYDCDVEPGRMFDDGEDVEGVPVLRPEADLGQLGEVCR